ncbi:triose-phosphate transporter family-domain-containing protein [Crassisporium funariophilum]|nr:triose-phosphate transporter family-domain-containing protein [Crassisporium funariophilum]
MKHISPSSQPLSASGTYGKENEPPSNGNALYEAPPVHIDSSRSGSYRDEAAERSHSHRSRTLRVNTLHQRVYHHDETSPLPYSAVENSSLFAATPDLEERDELIHPSPLVRSPSKSRFRSTIQLRRFIPNPLLRRILSLPDSPQLWLGLYFTLNLSLTLYNKSVLSHFPFPYTLTALHALCGTIGTFILLRLDPGPGGTRNAARALTSVSPLHHSVMPNLNGRELVVLFLFSILYTVNIVVSNASLRLVTVPFHQVVRSSTPLFTILFSVILLRKRCSKEKLLSLIPVVAGVGFATYGDYYFTPFGFFLTLLGTLLAALKTILTNIILVKPASSPLPVSSNSSHRSVSPDGSTSPPKSFPSSFSSLLSVASAQIFPPSPLSSPPHSNKPLSKPPFLSLITLPKLSLGPLQLLYLLSPLAFVQTTLLAHFTGELERVRWHLFATASPTFTTGGVSSNFRLWLAFNGILAFFLNVVSFNANRRVGALGMTVAANVKQVLTVLCAVVIFDLTITAANALGIVLTLTGGALYAAVELREKQDKKRRMG